MVKKHHFLNMYITTTISISLVLFLVGFLVILGLTAHNLIKQVKESVALTVVLSDNVKPNEVQLLTSALKIASFCKEQTLITKEEALKEHIKSLGEDPSEFLGYNPLQTSIEIKLCEQYAQSDSIAKIEQKLKSYPFVDKLIYQKDVVDLLNNNIGTYSIVLAGIGLILLLISIILINNTIRIYIYSKRFLINTMKLVGATPWIIKGPIVRKNILLGMIAAIIAIAALVGTLFYCQYNLHILLVPIAIENIAIISGVVFLTGIVITLLASSIATSKFIRMKTNDLYYI